jgi:ClpP class serine protease
VKPIAITTGKYKGLGLPGVPISDEQIELLRDEVAVVFGWFKSAVLAGRGTVDDDYMQGQTLMGDAALPANLIDAVGDRKYAMAELENLMKGKAK